jgi:hypothetical protein
MLADPDRVDRTRASLNPAVGPGAPTSQSRDQRVAAMPERRNLRVVRGISL